MKKSRYTEEQIIGILKLIVAGRAEGRSSRPGRSEATIYTSKGKYRGREASEARLLDESEDENRRLEHMVADLSLDRELCGR